MDKYLSSRPGGKKTRNGKMYYKEFKLEFWKKPGKYYLSLLFILILQSVILSFIIF